MNPTNLDPTIINSLDPSGFTKPYTKPANQTQPVANSTIDTQPEIMTNHTVTNSTSETNKTDTNV